MTCFWDSIANDHVVEVKKYRGDAFFPSLAQFFRDLKSAIVKEDSASGAREVPVASSSSGSRLRGGALPMPSLRRAQTAPPTSSTMSSPSSSACCMVTEDMFLLGIQPLFNMAQDNFLEPRLEAAKALCDLARKEKKFLELPTCREQCVHAINALLRDDFEDVKQFAVMAFASFCEIPSYQVSCYCCAFLFPFLCLLLLALLSLAWCSTPPLSTLFLPLSRLRPFSTSFLLTRPSCIFTSFVGKFQQDFFTFHHC